MAKLLTALEDSQRGCFDSQTDVKECITHLHKAAPSWMKMLNLPTGVFVKINPEYKRTKIREDVEKYVNTVHRQ